MDKKVNININGIDLLADQGDTILKAAEKNDIFIPRLCFLKDVHEEGNCRICSVKVEGQKNLKPSCKTIVEEGMKITTDDQEVYDNVTLNLELLTHRHQFECFKCSRENNCEFLDLLRKYSIDNEYTNAYGPCDLDFYHYQDDSKVMVIDSSKCILCGRCVSACEKYSGLSVLHFNERGNKTYVGPALFHDIADSGCIYCGKCIGACPTGAIKGYDYIKHMERDLRDPNKKIVVQVAPAVRAALGEEFGYPIGTNVEGKMFSALKKLGVDEIMDTNFTADLTIMEEGTELIHRLETGGKFPMFTSCSPGWINLLELYYPEFIPNLSSCKSPQQMAGALIKTYYAEKMEVDPKNIVSVSIMPCIAKKAEANRKEMGRDGYQDVDYVLTTREFARLIRRRGIDFQNLEEGKPFGMLASYTGAGAIFGATGGVMEAALRTVSEILENKSTPVEFKSVRGIFSLSTSVNIALWNLIAKGMAGNPPPEPISMMLPANGSSTPDSNGINESSRCFFMSSSRVLYLMRFCLLFSSSSKSRYLLYKFILLIFNFLPSLTNKNRSSCARAPVSSCKFDYNSLII